MEINLSKSKQLVGLYCSETSISSLELNYVPNLTTLVCSNNNLSIIAIDSILVDLDSNGKEEGFANLTGNSVPGVSGQTALSNLVTKQWSIDVDI